MWIVTDFCQRSICLEWLYLYYQNKFVMGDVLLPNVLDILVCSIIQQRIGEPVFFILWSLPQILTNSLDKADFGSQRKK